MFLIYIVLCLHVHFLTFLLLKTENQMIVPALKSLAWVIFTISMISVTLLRADSWVGWPNNNYCFHSIFSFNKKESLSCQFANYQWNAVWVSDITNRTNGFFNVQSYHQVVTYLFNSLAKSCTLFWKYS